MRLVTPAFRFGHTMAWSSLFGLGAALLEAAEVIVQRLQPDPSASVIDAMERNKVLL
jgi:hypothetical protein